MAVTLRAAGTRTAGVSTASALAPAGVAAGDRSILIVSVRPATAVVTTPTGWTYAFDYTGGTGAAGNTTGPSRTYVFYRDDVFTSTTAVSVAGASRTFAQTFAYTKTLGAWAPLVVVGGQDVTAGSTAFSATATANLTDWTTGSAVLGSLMAADGATGAAAVGTGITAPGMTGGTLTTHGFSNATTGVTYSTICYTLAGATGTATGAPTAAFTLTGSTNSYGPAVFVLLRDTTNASSVALTPAVVASSAVPVAGVPQPVGVSLAPAALAAGPVALDPTVSPVGVSLAPAIVGSAVVDLVETLSPVARTLTPAVAVSVGVALVGVPQPVTRSLSPAVLGSAATPLGVGVPPSTATLSPASVGAGAVGLAGAPGVIARTLTPASVGSAAAGLAGASGATSVALSPASAGVSALPVVGTPQAITRTLTPAAAGSSAPALGVAGATLLTLSPVTVGAAARQLGLGAITVPLTSATVGTAARQLVATPQLQLVPAAVSTAALGVSLQPVVPLRAADVGLVATLLDPSAPTFLVLTPAGLGTAAVPVIASNLIVGDSSATVLPAARDVATVGGAQSRVTVGSEAESVALLRTP